MKSDSRALANR